MFMPLNLREGLEILRKQSSKVPSIIIVTEAMLFSQFTVSMHDSRKDCLLQVHLN